MRKPKDIKIDNYTLEEILIRHKHWLNEDCENWKYMKADLSYAGLRDADLCGADLSYADLHGANMCGANMRGANMCGANMCDAIMCGANMRNANMCDAIMCDANMRDAIMCDANMRGTDMCGTDLSYADLRGANMCSANMCGANMRGANMCGANMCDAIMCGANMRNANMCGAIMCDANMRDAKMRGANIFGTELRGADRLRKGIKLCEPIIGWKKCNNNVLVKLEIPRGAIVFSINNNECRTDKANVIEIIGGNRAYSKHKFFSYYVGDIIEVFNFNCEYNVECAEGIHFFRTREEAENIKCD